MPLHLDEGSIGAAGIRRIKKIIISFSLDIDRTIQLNNQCEVLSSHIVNNMLRDLASIANIALVLNNHIYDHINMTAVSDALQLMREYTESEVDILFASAIEAMSNNEHQPLNDNNIRIITMEHIRYNLSIAVLKMEFAIVQCELLMDLFSQYTYTE